MEFMGPPRLMIVSDLDNTMVDHQDHDNKSLLRFGALWQADYNHDSLLVYSTGRSPALYAKLREDVPLLTPGITIMSVGTEIRYGDTMAPDHGWEEELSEGWDREAIVEEAAKLDLKFQVESEQRPHKVSFYVDKKEAEHVLATLTERFKVRGPPRGPREVFGIGEACIFVRRSAGAAHASVVELNAKLIYSGGVDLDVLPTGAGKGQALAYLMRKLKSEGRTPGHTLVCGDSGNDAELFAVPDVYGVIVGNAMEELLQWHTQYEGDKSHIFLAKKRCAAGILQAMQHFDLQPNVSPRDYELDLLPGGQGPKLGVLAAAHEVVEYLLLMEQWIKGDVENSDTVFNRLKFSLEPDSSLVHAYGIISNAHEEIDTIHNMHGVKKGKIFAIWVDRVRIEALSDHLYLARFDKWERTDHHLTCAITTALLQANAECAHGLEWKLIHETWLAGREGSAPTAA